MKTEKPRKKTAVGKTGNRKLGNLKISNEKCQERRKCDRRNSIGKQSRESVESVRKKKR